MTVQVQNPTAVQAVADAHDTLRKPVSLRAPGLTTFRARRIDHLVPFQCSANAPAAPTAMHAVADAHDTLDRPLRLGSRCIDHLRPFQRSAPFPTAKHCLGDVQDTLLSSPTPELLAVRWIDHRRPSQRSASATRLPALVVDPPTAKQALADAHDTPLSRVAGAPALGIRWIDHFEPFHRSASARAGPKLPGPVMCSVTPHGDARGG